MSATERAMLSSGGFHMRPTVRMIGGMLSVLTLAAATASYAAPQAERELLGVRLWRDHASVLKKHGTPTRIVEGVALAPVQQAQNTQVTMGGGGASAGMPGMPSMGGMPGMPSMPSMAAGAGAGPGMAGPPTMGGGLRSRQARGGGGGMTGPGQFGGKSGDEAASAGGGMSSALGMMSSMMAGGAGAPGMPSLPSMGGMPGASEGANVNVGGSTQMSVADPEIRETWVYERGKQTFQFLFNKDGRVIRIESFGMKGTGATARGIGLGDDATKVYKAYGWPGKTVATGNGVTLDFSQKAHVLFDMIRVGKVLKVKGITIAASEIGG